MDKMVSVVAVQLLLSLAVAGARNLPPKFVSGSSMLDLVISEATPVGTQIYQVLATDPDGDVVYYSISGDFLSTDRESGSVTLVRPVDRELMRTVEVILTLTDEPADGSEPHVVSVRRLVPVIDANDNAPVFSDASDGVYRFSVDETAEIGSTVFSKIHVTDADFGRNGEISLKCNDIETKYGCGRFGVRGVELSNDVFVGIVTVKAALDYEKEKQFDLSVLASDHGEPPLNASARILISVRDSQDQPPVFLNGPFVAVLPENTAEGTTVLTILAQDGDTGSPRDLSITIVGDHERYFRLGQPTKDGSGVFSVEILTSARLIDREHENILNNAGIYKFSVEAEEIDENGGRASLTVSNVTIIVTDANDEPPMFNRNDFNISIPENIEEGSFLPDIDLIVSDLDSGNWSQVYLSIEDVSNSEAVFDVFPKTASSKAPVVISVVKADRLDYERSDGRHFVFDVVASQLNYSTSARVSVHVTDTNDNPPSFRQTAYSLSVPEDAATGFELGHVTAVDPDSGSLGQLCYRLVGSEAAQFSVECDGRVTLSHCPNSSCLDFERQQEYFLQLVATDGGNLSATTALLVVVSDINDNRPLFGQREFRRTIDLSASEFSPKFFIEASDADSGENGVISFSIIEGNDNGLFLIDASTGEVTISPEALAEVGQRAGLHSFIVEARDGGEPSLSSAVRVLISYGRNINQAPQFSRETYTVSIREDATPLSSILQLEAGDPDGPSQFVTYSLFSGGDDKFQVKSDGQLVIAADSLLDVDAEDASSYTLTVRATDAGTPPASSEASVLVTIEDINDEPPRLKPASYIDFVPESATVGTPVVRVRAEDPDSESDLQFAIVSPILARDRAGVAVDVAATDVPRWFSINRTTGVVQVAASLDFKMAASVQLTVEVSDLASETGLQFDRGEVTIFLQTTKDNRPQFDLPWLPTHPEIHLEVDEELQPGSNVYTLKAHDPVSGETVTDFREVAGSNSDNWFAIDSRVGEIMLKRRLDFETMIEKKLSLRVRALTGQRSSEATVHVQVRDTNDNVPVFSEKAYEVEVSEAAFYPDQVVQVLAEDLDSQHGYGNVTYRLTGATAGLFSMDPVSGTVRVAPGTVLDRESQQTHRLRVVAQDNPDNGEDPHTSSAQLVVKVKDVNDNRPVFDAKLGFTAVVAENSAVNTSVLHVLAVDRDSGENGRVSYRLLHQTEDLFDLGENSGDLTVLSSLAGRGRYDPYTLVVEAQDNGDEPLRSEAELKVYIGDVSFNDGVPRFIDPQPGAHTLIQENLPAGTFVYQVKAEDADDPRTASGRLRYSFLGTALPDRNDFFLIDGSTGTISTRQPLDREHQQQHCLTLLVSDSSLPANQATGSLQVIVDDVDDVPPHFVRDQNSPPLEEFVSEGTASGMTIATVRAVDQDTERYNQTHYTITGGNEDGVFRVRSGPDGAGELYLDTPLDRESRDIYLLTIRCSPGALQSSAVSEYDPKDMSMIRVTIHVTDVDDNAPIFQQSSIFSAVRAVTPIGTTVATLKASDPDEDSPAVRYNVEEITFSYHSPSFIGQSLSGDSVADSFVVDPITGQLWTNASMTQFSEGLFNITVAATCSNRSSFAAVQVYVLDEESALRFIFSESPGKVQARLPQLSSLLEQYIAGTSRLLLADTEYLQADSQVYYALSSACFQMTSHNKLMTPDEVISLMDTSTNQNLADVFRQYNIEGVKRCKSGTSGIRYRFSVVQAAILAVAIFILISTAAAILFLSCHRKRRPSHYDSKSSKPALSVSRPEHPPSVMLSNDYMTLTRAGSVASGVRGAAAPPTGADGSGSGSVHHYGFPVPLRSQFEHCRYVTR